MHMIEPLKESMEELSSQTAGMVSQVIRAATMQGQRADRCGHAIAVAGTLSGIEVLAALYGNPFDEGQTDGEPSIEKAVTNESSLFASLVVGASVNVHPSGEPCQCGNPHPHNTVDFGIKYGPHALLQAAQWYEAIKGERPDKHLNPTLVSALNEMRANPKELEQQTALATLRRGPLN